MSEGRFSSEKLEALMQEQGYNPESLASRIGVSMQSVYTWLNGSGKPQFASLIKLCSALNCELFELAELGTQEHSDLRPFETPLSIRNLANEVLREFPKAYWIEVRSTLACRTLPKGCYAFVNPDFGNVEDHGIYAVSVNGGYPVFGRLEELASGLRVIPWSYDPTATEIIVNYRKGDDADVLGKTVWCIQPLDNIT